MSDATAAVGALPCIRCGACVPVCPAHLHPQQLLWDLRAEQLPRAVAHGLTDCSECGQCDAVCPSRIALAQRFGLAKSMHARLEASTREAAAARDRFERRNLRLQTESVERAQRDSALSQQATSTDAVAAAIERARARRQSPGGST